MMRKGFLLSKKEQAENKKQTQYRQHQKENWTPADRIKAFQKSIEWGWSFGCSSCHRLFYREQVNDLKPRDQQHLMNMMKITSLKPRHEGECKLICKTCHPYLKEFIKTEEQLDKMKEERAENAPKLMLWIKEHGSIPGNWKICDHFDPPHNGDFGICEHTRTIQAEFEEFVQQEIADGQDSEEEESDTASEKSMDETQYLIKVLESESGCLCADEFMCSTCFCRQLSISEEELLEITEPADDEENVLRVKETEDGHTVLRVLPDDEPKIVILVPDDDPNCCYCSMEHICSLTFCEQRGISREELLERTEKQDELDEDGNTLLKLTHKIRPGFKVQPQSKVHAAPCSAEESILLVDGSQLCSEEFKVEELFTQDESDSSFEDDPNLGFVSDLGQDFNGLRDACNELNDVTDLIDLLKKL